jgi:predicted transcriptional regulator
MSKPRSKVRIEKSTRTRQAIIDACHYDILTIRQIAERLDIPCQGINIHLLNLVEDGYVSKHERVAKVNGQWSCGYTTISDQPYVWKYRDPSKNIEEPIEEPVALPVHMDMGLMIKLGYTNIIPRAGRVHQGFMSYNPQKRAINE